MRVKTRLQIGNITLDREPIGPSTLSLVDFLRGGGTVPPIHVELKAKGTWKILDGRHRVLAYKLLGRSEIDVKYGVTDTDDVVNDLCHSTGA